MINFKLWIKAARVPFFTATIVPITLGSVIAWHGTSAFSWIRFILAMFGGVLVHAGTNLANDYFDHISGCDEGNPNPTPFSGGSRVIQDGLIRPGQILLAASASFVIGGTIGLYLNHICKGNVILIIGIVGVLLGVFYTAKPLRIGYGTFGELAVGIGFGPLMVMGSYYVQAESLPIDVFLASLPIGILIALVLYINEFPDYAADKKVGKKTLVVLLGKKKAIVLYHALLALAYSLVVLFVILETLPKACLIALLTLPVAIKTFLVSRKNFDKIYELLPANAATISLHLSIGLLLCAGILIDRIIS